ncbi:MAG: hypothetical protein QM723_01690 [Myxococcaceae bacterium]
MKRLLPALFLIGFACVDHRTVGVTFGSDGEGLDGFLCKDSSGKMVLDRLEPDGGGIDGGLQPASLVTDFIRLGGLPGCRTGQLIDWCGDHTCAPIDSTRVCTPISLPSGVTGTPRETVRAEVKAALAQTLTGHEVIAQAPDEFVMLRMIATRQPCADVMPNQSGQLPPYDQTQLVGCAYSCVTNFNEVDQDVYIGFDSLTAMCEQGLRTCSDHELHWQP